MSAGDDEPAGSQKDSHTVRKRLFLLFHTPHCQVLTASPVATASAWFFFNLDFGIYSNVFNGVCINLDELVLGHETLLLL